jgi:uncharacterized protein YegJ (DUF2314 family)
MIWLAVGIVATLGVLVALWWRLRRKRSRLISFVALLREPVTFDPAVLARIAGKAWKADLGDGETQGADGFAVGVGLTNTIMHDGRMFLVHSIPAPYTPDVDKAADSIPDMRIRSLYRQHQAWFSCDALGVDCTTPEADVLDWYRRLGTLFVEFLDERCLLVLLPDSGLAFPINEDTEAALRAKDPVRALQESLTLPIIEVPNDDPLMKQAVEKARQSWPQFVAAFEAKGGQNYSVKAPVTHAGNTEFIWVTVTSIEGERIYGELGNDPGDLGPLKLGSKVLVPLADLNDWCYIDAKGDLVGGFTIEAVAAASRRSRAGKSAVG